MPAYVALLRAVNVGGTGKLAMRDLAALCEAQGFRGVRTYIASGNVVFADARDADTVRATLEAALAAHARTHIGVVMRTAAEMAAVLAANPFPDAPPNRTVAIFLDAPPPFDALDHARHTTRERMALGAREIYVAYDGGIGASRLVLPAARAGTARNLNTVATLAEMAAAIAG